MLGLEIGDVTVVAVAVDENGAVRARADVPLGADAGAAALSALASVSADSTLPGVGVAAVNPDARAVGAILESVRRQYGFNGASPTPSGVAAAVAEAWIGAAPDAKDIAYLSIADHTTAGIVRGG